MSKEFATVDVLSVVTGRLMGAMGGIYEVLGWMTDESLFTHQLPRVSREAQPVLIAAHPLLQQAVDESEQVTQENYQEWRDRWIDRYGPTIAIPKLTADSHERIDPMSELAEHFRPD